MQKRIAITEFKTNCLRLLEQVSQTGTGFVVTKRGKPVAHVSAPPAARSLAGTVKVRSSLAELLSTGARWDAE